MINSSTSSAPAKIAAVKSDPPLPRVLGTPCSFFAIKPGTINKPVEPSENNLVIFL
jgi:hypothetical protein